MRGELDGVGFDTSQNKQDIQHAIKKHTETLVSLMYGEPGIRIDNEEVSVASVGQQDSSKERFVEEFTVPRIEHKQKLVEHDESDHDDDD